MTDKTCNKCGVKGLWWNKKHFEKTGKWQLIDHKNKKGEWCVRNSSSKPIITKPKEKPRLCEYCLESNFGLCRTEKDYNIHVKTYHPNKEILTNVKQSAIDCMIHARSSTKEPIKCFIIGGRKS